MTLLYVLLAILLLGVLIIAHELGHFLAARATGIAVKEFSIGFGPKLWQRQSKKHGTLFTLRPVPMGGYCMFYGDTDDDPTGATKDDPRNYARAPVWKRILTVVAGPLMNLLLAFVVAVGFMAAYGTVQTAPYVYEVEAGMPAEQAGLLTGDEFVSLDGAPLADGTIQDVSDAISAAGAQPMRLTVLRGGEERTLELTPFYDEAEGRYRVGVTISARLVPLPVSRYIPEALDYMGFAARAILDALGKLVTTGEGLDQTAGPIGVVQLVAEQTQQNGLRMFLNLLIIISINLGLFNLIPIPGLDGSRLVFMLIEAARRKPVSQRVEAAVHMGGYVLLLGLMVFFTFKDIGRIFGA